MTNYEIAIKRCEQFDLISAYCLQIIEAFCRQYALEIVYTGEVGITKMGRTGIFALTRQSNKATRYLEISFFYENGQNGNILWEPHSPVIKSY